MEWQLQRALRLLEDEGPMGHLSDVFDDLASRSVADGRRPTVLFLPELEARCFWDAEDLAGAFETLFDARGDIRAEFRALQNSDLQPGRISKHATDNSWSQHYLLEEGKWNDDIARLCPQTTAALRRLPLFETSLGYAYFSTLEAGGRIRPHCGASNTKLRLQLPLLGGSDASGRAAITVGAETQVYGEGPFAFDDSYPHSVQNDSSSVRTVLLVDVWHPRLTTAARRQILAAFLPKRGRGGHGGGRGGEAAAAAAVLLPACTGCTARERQYLLRRLLADHSKDHGLRTTVRGADGTSVTVPAARGRVLDLKRELERRLHAYEPSHWRAYHIELFVAGEEQPLEDERELHRLPRDARTGALDLFLVEGGADREPVHWLPLAGGEPNHQGDAQVTSHAQTLAEFSSSLGVQLLPFEKPTQQPYPYHHMVKALMVGDCGVGKTAFLQRFTDDRFTDAFIHTIGIDFKVRTAVSSNQVGFQYRFHSTPLKPHWRQTTAHSHQLRNLRASLMWPQVAKAQLWDMVGPENHKFRQMRSSFFRGADVVRKSNLFQKSVDYRVVL
jgi:hypothetical protein